MGINIPPNGGLHEARSDWRVAEVITWSRSLTGAEMKRVTEYLESAVLGRSGELVDGFNEIKPVKVHAAPFIAKTTSFHSHACVQTRDKLTRNSSESVGYPHPAWRR